MDGKKAGKVILLITVILIILIILGVLGYFIYFLYLNKQYVIHYKQVILRSAYSPEITASTVDDAINACSAKSDCVGFVWDVSGRKAFLRNGFSGIAGSSAYDSYVKSVKNNEWPN